ncbi:MAG: hypothetical protein JNL88_01645 [Bacteroidia bacterium]|nr:hypothetical protein [Bacteroidia bacterium]
MKKHLAFVLLSFLSGHLKAQYNPDWVVPAAEYQKTGVMMACDTGNNLIITGYRPSYLGAAHIYTRKFDETGNLLWERTDSSGVPQKYQRPAWVNVDAQNNIYVCGYRYAGTGTISSDTILAIKYDPNGTLLWKKNLADLHLGPLPMRSELDAAGNFYIATINPAGPGFYLVKFDPNGNVLFTVSNSSTGNISMNSMRIRNDKIVLGSYASLGSIACVAVFDTSGNFLWGNNYPTWGVSDLEIDSAENIYFISRKENQVAASSGFDISLYKLNPNGSVAAITHYDFGNSTDAPARMTLVNGKISVTGWTVQAGSPYMNWVTFQSDLNGNLLWQAIYNQTSSNDEIPYWISAKPGGEVFVSGKGGPDTIGFNGSVYLRYVTLKYINGQVQWVDADPYQGYTGIANCIAGDGSLYVLGEYAMTAIHYVDNGASTGLDPYAPVPTAILYPNPTTGHLRIAFESERASEARLTLFDGRGRVMRTIYPLEIRTGKNEVSLDLTTAEPGLYTGILESPVQRLRFKIIRQ